MRSRRVKSRRVKSRRVKSPRRNRVKSRAKSRVKSRRRSRRSYNQLNVTHNTELSRLLRQYMSPNDIEAVVDVFHQPDNIREEAELEVKEARKIAEKRRRVAIRKTLPELWKKEYEKSADKIEKTDFVGLDAVAISFEDQEGQVQNGIIFHYDNGNENYYGFYPIEFEYWRSREPSNIADALISGQSHELLELDSEHHPEERLLFFIQNL